MDDERLEEYATRIDELERVQWAMRIKLIADETNDPFEKARPGGGRGWKLKGSMVPVARSLLEEMRR